MTKLKTKFLILGGGLSGLFTALFLQAQGQKSVLLEKSDDIGGLARTYSFKGHSFDIGGHRISFHDEKNIQLLHSLVPELAVLTRESKIYYDDIYIDYPISAASLKKFSKTTLLKIFFEVAFSNRFAKPKNFEEWVKKYYGSTLYKIVFEHYSKKVWGRECSALSENWAKSRIGYYSLSNLFLNNKAKEGKRQFYYPKYGIGILAQSIAKKLEPETTILKDASIQEMILNNSNITNVKLKTPKVNYEIECSHIISTIPLTELLNIPPLDSNNTLQNLSRKIKYRSFLQVNLLLDREQASDWHWCYFPDENLMFSRCYEPKYWHKKMSENEKGTMLCVEILCDYQDEIWTMEEDVLFKKLCKQLVEVGLIKNIEECKDFYIAKERFAYPLPYLKYDNYVKNIVNELSSNISNLHFAGRNGTHTYYDIEECLACTQALTKKLLS